MNVPKAIEIAMLETLRANAEVGEGVTWRAWQTLSTDAAWSSETDRAFPMVGLTCAVPVVNEDQVTLSASVEISLLTKADDDKDHAFISQMYDGIQAVLDDLFACRGSTTTEPLQTFLAHMSDNVATGLFSFGGFTFGDGQGPIVDVDQNSISIVVAVHYSRSDF